VYRIDPKSLQLRWTDIEIRKYRLRNKSSSPAKKEDEQSKADAA